MILYRGKEGELTSGKGLGYDVVFRLMGNFLDRGYSLYVDNFYTSPTLAKDLFCHSTHLTGTLDRNRRGVPKQVKDILSAASAPRGSGAYVRDDETAYSVWKDTKCMSVLSTKHPGHSENKVQRNTKGSV